MAGNSGDGSVEAFDDFFLRILPWTIRSARRLTGDPFLAEDVAVEALARAHARWERAGAPSLARRLGAQGRLPGGPPPGAASPAGISPGR